MLRPAFPSLPAHFPVYSADFLSAPVVSDLGLRSLLSPAFVDRWGTAPRFYFQSASVSTSATGCYFRVKPVLFLSYRIKSSWFTSFNCSQTIVFQTHLHVLGEMSVRT
jgi:hypothetical protein